MPNRRKLAIAIGLGVLTTPLAVFSQPQSKVWRIGVLSQRSRRPETLENDYFLGPFLKGLRDLGYAEGKSLNIEWRFAGNEGELLSKFAEELVKLKVDVIVTTGTQATTAAQAATKSIPIVFGSVTDPVGSGFIASLARPGGNITGLTNQTSDVSSKYLEMLRNMLPQLSRVAVLINPGNSSHSAIYKSIQFSAMKIDVTVIPVEAATVPGIEDAFSKIAREKAGALIVATDNFFIQHLRLIANLATKNRLPSISAGANYVDAGGLMSYGRNVPESWRRAAVYVDKILKGAKPNDLPVEQPTIFEMTINGKTARALGLKIPQSLLIGTDKIIE